MRRRMQRSIDRNIGRRPSRLIVHDRSLIATISRTISYDGSCHRYSPIVRDSATTRRPLQIDRGMRPLLEIVANIADRSHHGPIATNRTIQKPYDSLWLWFKSLWRTRVQIHGNSTPTQHLKWRHSNGNTRRGPSSAFRRQPLHSTILKTFTFIAVDTTRIGHGPDRHDVPDRWVCVCVSRTPK